MKANRTIKLSYCFLLLVLLLALSGTAKANVIALPPIGGQGAFRDLSTGFDWMMVSDFYGMTYNAILASLPNGFTIATLPQIQQLHSSLPFASYSQWAPIVGDHDRGYTRIVWGFYDIGDPVLAGESWMYSNASTFTGGVWNYSTLGGPGWSAYTDWRDSTSSDDLGAWVVNTGSVVSAVPEPATMLLLGSGLIGLWGFRKVFRK